VEPLVRPLSSYFGIDEQPGFVGQFCLIWERG
jgi:hypothetical protein